MRVVLLRTGIYLSMSTFCPLLNFTTKNVQELTQWYKYKMLCHNEINVLRQYAL